MTDVLPEDEPGAKERFNNAVKTALSKPPKPRDSEKAKSGRVKKVKTDPAATIRPG